MYNPLITKQIGRSTKLIDLPTELLSQRIINIGTEIDDHVSNSIIQQLLWLSSDSKDDIDMYIQSPGGNVYAGLAIYDTIKILESKGIKVNTIGTGMVASMGTFLLSCGTGIRRATKNCRIMIHSVSSGTRGTIHDMEIDYNESKYLNDKLMVEYVNFSKGKCVLEDIKRKTQRDLYMSPEEYINMGLLDNII